MRKITLLTLAVVLITLATNSFAGNWKYNSTNSTWVKNITPEMYLFNKLNTATVQGSIVVNGGSANPSPYITTTTGQDLSNGYLVVTGGQITSSTPVANILKGFVIPDTTIFAPGTLRFAAASSTVTDGGKIGVTGFVNVNFYVPTKYNRTNYTLQVSDSVYTSTASSISLTSYHETDALQFNQVSNATAGWKYITVAQSTFAPFRAKLALPNTSTLIAYIKPPRFELLSATEPATRTVTVTTSADGTVTPTYGNLHDQDVETFTITPNAGKTIDVLSYNGVAVTPVKNGSTFYYTTPLLTADATFAVTYKTDLGTGIQDNKTLPSFITSSKGGSLQIDGLVAGQSIAVFAINGRQVLRSVAVQSSTSISLSKGVYFVKVDGKVSKIVL